uniref:Secreted protein n=1 Tax=Steinernema glaseri TaxID=37863 RepID=A0A1I7Z5P7_9BILA
MFYSFLWLAVLMLLFSTNVPCRVNVVGSDADGSGDRMGSADANRSLMDLHAMFLKSFLRLTGTINETGDKGWSSP